MEEPTKNETDFYYEVDPSYRVVAANSILTTIRGNDIKLDFAIESLALPKRIRQDATGIVDVDPDYKMVRNVQVGIFCSLEKAEEFADFIKEQTAKFKKLQKP